MTTAYVTYTYYTTTYLGTAIASADFARLALRASASINSMTFGRAADETDLTIIDNIKMACCAVAEEIQRQEASPDDAIQSESIGANSVTYAATSSKLLTNEAKREKAAKEYLGNTGLMFKGFASGEYSGAVDADE
jgi:hypothetical protein